MNRSIKVRRLFPLVGLAAALLAGNAAAESLQQAWDTALAVDRGLKASRENTAAAASLLDAAKSARLPNVALEAGYTALGETPAAQVDFFGQSLQMPLAQRESAAYKAMATLPLYTGGRIARGIDAATAGLDAASGGTVIMEQIFVIPGMGLLLLEAVQQRDYPIITGVFLIVGVAVMLINLAVDLSYGLLDPKVRYR